MWETGGHHRSRDIVAITVAEMILKVAVGSLTATRSANFDGRRGGRTPSRIVFTVKEIAAVKPSQVLFLSAV
ncbi:hypothetical protein ACLBXB_20710 [Methylobacterium mesophilicum]